ncbi:DUF4013 domain-containing protein [Methanobrevibacter filiformis]|uniref:Glycerophosphoryl diester phosphodiesterase membrane domain-containing protein n=1 Tax=Methanobrevibacter filiformis TaxID=55758 RepID=A0A166CG21_9EURY|nr:DUF4013 domain-containing protein [Methanobrevibacter filiformis]KZX14471.1 hypothetical protein MBFIL_08680 [Methanobrevibacter filiformis]
MSLKEILRDGFDYPLKNWNIFVIIGIIYLIADTPNILSKLGVIPLSPSFLSAEWIIFIIATITALIFALLLEGYVLSILRDTINNISELPPLKVVENIILGIKGTFVAIVYYLIPTIITAIIGIISLYGSLVKILPAIMKYGAQYANYVPQDLLINFIVGFGVTLLIGVILFIITSLIATIAVCRLTKYDSIGQAFKIREILKDIRKIGWGRYIGYLIVSGIIAFVITVIFSLIFVLFGIIGTIIQTFLVNTYIIIFQYRILGSIYKLSEDENEPYIDNNYGFVKDN